MVRKEIRPLYELCVEHISDKIWKFTMEHCRSCRFCKHSKPEKCLIFRNAVFSFRCLPNTVIQSIFEKVYLHFEVYESFKQYERRTSVLYSVSSLLRLNTTSFKIKFSFTIGKDVTFVTKFGKNIDLMCFEDTRTHPPVILRTCYVDLTLWENILKNASNIQVLNLKHVKLSGEFLEIVGRELSQLKVIDGIEADADYFRYEEEPGITPWSITQLFFRDGENGSLRNPCCDTLRAINFILKYDDFPIHYTSVSEVVSILLENAPNLQTIGTKFKVDTYVRKVCSDSQLASTNLEEVNVKNLTNDLIPMLATFCPKVKKFKIYESEPGVLQNLSSFQYLEELHVIYGSDSVTCYNTFTPGSSLTKLKIKCSFDVDIDILATNLPLLTEIYILHCNNVTWNRKTYFKCLEKAEFRAVQKDISWCESFANTITSFKLCYEDYLIFGEGPCHIFLSNPFPKLEELYLENFYYDFEFLSSMIANLSQLKSFGRLYRADHFNWEWNINRLSQCMKVNNLECKIY